MENNELTATVQDLAKVRKLIKELSAKEKQLANAVKAHYSKPCKVLVGTIMVKLVQNKGRVTYDTKAMIDDGMNLEPYKKEGAPIMVLTVEDLDAGV